MLAVSLMSMMGYVSAAGEVNISDAEHLNTTRLNISNIFASVNASDATWSPNIKDREWVRVTFQEDLNNESIVEIVVRNTDLTNTSIEIYEKDKNQMVGRFGIINNNVTVNLFTRLLFLIGSTNIFDFKIVNNQSNSTAFLSFNFFHDQPQNVFRVDDGDFSDFAQGSNVKLTSFPLGGIAIQAENDDNNWALIGRENSPGGGGTQDDVNASINMTYDISSQNFNTETITEFTFQLGYCHSRITDLPFKCKKLQNNVQYNFPEAQIYNYTSNRYQPMGVIPLADGTEQLISFTITGGFDEFIENDRVHVRYPIDMTITQNGRDACLGIDFAPLTVSFLSNNVTDVVFTPQSQFGGKVPFVKLGTDTRFYNSSVPYVLGGNKTVLP